MIEITNMDFAYPRKPLLFKGLNLKLQPGHIYGLIGKNGAGKSTLLKNMTGLAFPKKGSCRFNGVSVANRPVSVLKNIYFVAEEIFVPALTPAQFVANTAVFYPKFNTADFYHYLKLLEVDVDAAMNKLSFGAQKKAMIAFGLATNTDLLIMDEPTNGLDITSKAQFRKLIASVLNDNRCIIISTHQVRDLESLIDTILILHHREIMVNQTVDELAEKVVFGSFANTEDMPVLYQEENVRGINAIIKNTSGKSGKIDLELLFNAVTNGSTPLLETLNPN